MGAYYADYDEESQMWCVFHTDHKSGHAYASFVDSDSAEADAAKRNGDDDPDRLTITDDTLLKKLFHEQTT